MLLGPLHIMAYNASQNNILDSGPVTKFVLIKSLNFAKIRNGASSFAASTNLTLHELWDNFVYLKCQSISKQFLRNLCCHE